MGEKKVQLINFVTAAFSPHVRNSWLPNPGNFCLRNPESWALESGIQLKESGIPLTKNPESSTLNPKSTARNPESKTVLDSLTWRMGGGGGRGTGEGSGGDACSFFVPVSLSYSD